MTKKPFLNALVAVVYIAVLVLFMNYASRTFPGGNQTVIPIIMICLFTLSAAIMGYLFCYQPITLYLNGKQQIAVKLFLRTILFFAIFTIIFITVLFLKIFPS